MTDQVDLLGRGELRELLGRAVARRDAVGLECAQDAADARVRVLDVVNRVLRVLLDREVEVEVEQGVGLAHVEEEAGGVDRHLVEQVAELDRLAGALAHAHDLAVAHQADELHQDDLELVRILADGVHRALHAGHVAVVVAAPDVDEQVKAAVEFVLVVGDVRREIRRVAVGADEHLVLLAAELGRLVPDGAVLFVGQAAVAQIIDNRHDLAVFVQVAFEEPAVVVDAVLLHVRLHLGDVARQAEADERGAALLLGNAHQRVAVFRGVFFGEVENVLAVVAVLGELGRVFREELLVADRERKAEFVELVARVVDVEFAPDVVAGRVEHGGEAVAERAAAGVAHVHRAGRVCGDEFHHDAALFAVVAAAVVLAGGEHVLQHVGVEGRAQKEVHKAGAGGFRFREIGAGEVEVFENGRRDLLRRGAEGACRNHRRVRREIAVRAVGGALHRESGDLRLRERAGVHGLFKGAAYGGADLFSCNAYRFGHRDFPFRLDFVFRSRPVQFDGAPSCALPHFFRRTRISLSEERCASRSSV